MSEYHTFQVLLVWVTHVEGGPAPPELCMWMCRRALEEGSHTWAPCRATASEAAASALRPLPPRSGSHHAQNVLTVVTLGCDPHYPRDPLTRLTDEETEALRLPDSTKTHLPEEETLTEAKGLKGPDTHQVNPARGPGC